MLAKNEDGDVQNTITKEAMKSIMKEYKVFNGGSAGLNKKKNSGPKRGKKPYDFFCSEFHASKPKPRDFNFINVEVRKTWVDMTEVQKKPY